MPRSNAVWRKGWGSGVLNGFLLANALSLSSLSESSSTWTPSLNNLSWKGRGWKHMKQIGVKIFKINCRFSINGCHSIKIKVITPGQSQRSQILQWTNQGSGRNLATGGKRGKSRQPREHNSRFVLISQLVGWESSPFVLIGQTRLHERFEPLTELRKTSKERKQTKKIENFSKLLDWWRITLEYTFLFAAY